MTEGYAPSKYREKCLSKKDEQCVECGVTEDIVVHHVDGDQDNHNIENLIPVCEACHAKIHAHRESVGKWVKELGYEPKPPERTTLYVSKEVWSYLNSRFKSPEDTFDTVLRRELGIGPQRESDEEPEAEA